MLLEVVKTDIHQRQRFLSLPFPYSGGIPPTFWQEGGKLREGSDEDDLGGGGVCTGNGDDYGTAAADKMMMKHLREEWGREGRKAAVWNGEERW